MRIFYDGAYRLKAFCYSLAWEVCVFVSLLLEWCKGCKGWCVVPCRVVDVIFLFVICGMGGNIPVGNKKAHGLVLFSRGRCRDRN